MTLNNAQIAEVQATMTRLALALAQSGAAVPPELAEAFAAAQGHLASATQIQPYHVFRCPACGTEKTVPGLLPHNTVIPCGTCGWAGHASMPHIVTRTVGPDGRDCAMPGTPAASA